MSQRSSYRSGGTATATFQRLPVEAPQLPQPETEKLLQGEVPAWLIRFRQWSCLYLIFTNLLSVLTWELFWCSVDGDSWFSHFRYFTNWALLAATAFFMRLSYRKHQTMDPVAELLLEIALPFSFLSSLAYWGFIFNPSRVFHPAHGHFVLPLIKEISVHGISTALLFYDSLYNESFFPWSHFRYNLIFGVFYQIFAYLDFLSSGVWIYPFLDWKNSPQAVLGLYTAFIMTYLLICALQRGRNWLWPPGHPNGRASEEIPLAKGIHRKNKENSAISMNRGKKGE